MRIGNPDHQGYFLKYPSCAGILQHLQEQCYNTCNTCDISSLSRFVRVRPCPRHKPGGHPISDSSIVTMLRNACPEDAASGTCRPGGRLTLGFSHTQPLKAHQCVQLQTTGAAEAMCFCSIKTAQVGAQSRVLFDSLGKWVLKVSPHVGAAFNPQREACFLRRLQTAAWAPQLLCHSDIGVVYEAVGEPVSPHNLPRDWQAQTRSVFIPRT